MRKILMVLGVLVPLAGCVTTVVPDSDTRDVAASNLFGYQEIPVAPYGVITVKRDSGVLGSACLVGFYMDGKIAAKLDTSELARFNASAGEHLIGIAPASGGLCGNYVLREQSVVIRQGETRRYRISTNMNTGPALTPTSF